MQHAGWEHLARQQHEEDVASRTEGRAHAVARLGRAHVHLRMKGCPSLELSCGGPLAASYFAHRLRWVHSAPSHSSCPSLASVPPCQSQEEPEQQILPIVYVIQSHHGSHEPY